MSNEIKIILNMSDPEDDGTPLDLSVFLKKVDYFFKFLRSSAKETGDKNAAFPMHDISHKSPWRIACTPTSSFPLFRAADSNLIVDKVNSNLSAVAENDARDLPIQVLSALERMSKPDVRKAPDKIQIVNGVADPIFECQMDYQFWENAVNAHPNIVSDISTVSGKLYHINIRNKAKMIFTISAFPSSVICQFDGEMLEIVQRALNKNVAVSGDCTYMPGSGFPCKIKVHDINILPDNKDLPSFADIDGILPNATENKSSEQFVRELRDQWGR